MHKYKVVYLDFQETKRRCFVFADSESEALQHIIDLKHTIAVRDFGKLLEPPKLIKDIFHLERLSYRELADILRLLAYTKRAGLSSTGSFETLVSMGTRHQILFCSRVLSLLKNGVSLADAVQQYEYMLPVTISGVLRSSSESDKLYDVLIDLAEQLEQNLSITSKVKTALIYPIIVLAVALLVTIFLFVKIIPEVADILQDLGGSTLPATTQGILALGSFLSHYGILLLMGLALLVFLYLIIFHKKHKWIKAKLRARLPILRRIVMPGELSKFYSHFAFLLSAGFAIDTSLQLAADTCDNEYIKHRLLLAQSFLQRGFSITEALKSTGVINSASLQLIYTGSLSGNLMEVCRSLADQLRDETNRAIARLLKILEPAVMLVIGAIVGVIMVAVYQPLFEMMTVV